MITRNLIRSLLLLAAGAGIAVTWMAIATGPGDGVPTVGGSASASQVWTCSMHPQIRMDHKDFCPLCGMDLTPVKSSAGGGDGPADQLSLSSYAQMMARVATTPVRRQELFKDIRTVGRVELDETRVAHIASRVEGRVDQVFADFPGTIVKEAEHLVSIYSPQLVTTQEEFLIAVRAEQERLKSAGRESGVSLSSSALRRLELWGLSKQQLEELAQRGTAETHLIVYAPRVGRDAAHGDPLGRRHGRGTDHAVHHALRVLLGRGREGATP
jgi:Cu(I)/Ag(I) efflux system membrane fusion protein